MDIPDTGDQHLKNLTKTSTTPNMRSPESHLQFATIQQLQDMEERLTSLIYSRNSERKDCALRRPHPYKSKYKSSVSHTITPLNVSMAELVLAISNKSFFRSPPIKSRPPSLSRDETRYCAYHQDTGHDTESCRQLRALVENLIRAGELKEFILSGSTEPAGRPGKEPARCQIESAPSNSTLVEEYLPTFVNRNNSDSKRQKDYSEEATSNTETSKQNYGSQ